MRIGKGCKFNFILILISVIICYSQPGYCIDLTSKTYLRNPLIFNGNRTGSKRVSTSFSKKQFNVKPTDSLRIKDNAVGRKIPVDIYALPDAGLAIGVFQLDISPYTITRRDNRNDIKRKINGYMRAVEETLTQSIYSIDKSQKPDLIIFPEGLCAFSADAQKYARLIDNIFRKRLKSIIKISEEENITIGLGTLLKDSSGALAGSYSIITPEGAVSNYIKNKFYKENRIFEINGIKIGLVICVEFEATFPTSTIDKLKNSDVDIVMAPLYTLSLFKGPSPFKKYRQSALKHGIKVIFVNNISSEFILSGGSTWCLADSKDIFLPKKEHIAIVGFNKDENVPANASPGKAERVYVELASTLKKKIGSITEWTDL